MYLYVTQELMVCFLFQGAFSGSMSILRSSRKWNDTNTWRTHSPVKLIKRSPAFNNICSTLNKAQGNVICLLQGISPNPNEKSRHFAWLGNSDTMIIHPLQHPKPGTLWGFAHWTWSWWTTTLVTMERSLLSSGNVVDFTLANHWQIDLYLTEQALHAKEPVVCCYRIFFGSLAWLWTNPYTQTSMPTSIYPPTNLGKHAFTHVPACISLSS